MTLTKRITDFRVSWTADHEQYYQDHSIMFSGYTHSGHGCGETLRKACDSAIDDLVQQGELPEDWEYCTLFEKALTELSSQVKDPAMLDWDIVKGYCKLEGKHPQNCPDCLGNGNVAQINDDCITCDGTGESPFEYDSDPDCSVCAGEWHYYVNIDVKVE